MSSLRIHTLRGMFWATVQRTSGQAISLAAFVVLSRLVEPSAFGVLALANAYLLVALLFIEQGINQVLVQRSEISEDHLDTSFTLSLLLAVGLTLLTLVLAGPLARLFREANLEPVLLWISPTLLFGALRATQTAILQRRFHFRALAIRTTVAEGVGATVGIGMALAGFGLWSLVGQALGRGLAGVVVLWRVSDWRPRLRITRRPLGDIARFGPPVLGDRLVGWVQGKADDLIIGLVLGVTALGYYSLGYRALTYLTQLLVGGVQSVGLSAFSRLQGDFERFRRAFLTMLEYLALAAFPVFVGVALVAPEGVPLVFGTGWGPSIPVVQVLALAGAAKTLPLATSTAFIALGRPGLQLRLSFWTTLLATLGFALVAPRGITAMALVHLVIALLIIPLHVLLLRRTVSVRPVAYFLAIRVAAAGVAVMVATVLGLERVWPFPMPSVVWLIVKMAAGAGAYATVIYVFGRGSLVRAQEALREGILAAGEPPIDVGAGAL